MADVFTNVKAGIRNSGAVYQSVQTALGNNAFSRLSGCENLSQFNDNLGALFGGEGYGNSEFMSGFKSVARPNNIAAIRSSLARTDFLEPVSTVFTDDMVRRISRMEGLSGSESFTLANFKGSSQETKAVNIILNTQNTLQTQAAEEMYKTVSIRYEDEGIRINVRAAGVGSYVNNAKSWVSMTDLTPIFGVLRTGDIFQDDLLAVYPVYSEDPSFIDANKFVTSDIAIAEEKTYPAGDAYGRQSHLTQMLAVPCNITNLLGLCTAPGQRGWTDTDDLESSSITFMKVGAKVTIAGTTGQVFVDTSSMTNIAMSPTSVGQNSNDRDADITLRNVPVSTLMDKEGNSVKALFQSFYAKGYEVNLQFRMTGRFNRQGYALNLTAGKVVVDSLTRLVDNKKITTTTANTDELAMFGQIDGVVNATTPAMNLTNASNGNFGYRMEVYDTVKELTTRRQDPVSVKYPVRADDVNKEALDDAISYVGQTIKLACSRRAHTEAFRHFDYLKSMDGAPVVDNNNGGNDLPGRMFCNVAAVKRSFAIKDRVSALENISVFDNVCAVIINEIQDVTAALEFKSGIAAINEYTGVEKAKWSIVIHQNLHRFLMRVGDARISGAAQFKIVPSNFDMMIGKIIVIPENDSTEERINPLAGIGVNVAKENITLHGQVTRGNQDFGIMMTMPCFRQWNLNVLMGMIELTDAADFLDDQGMFYKLGGIAIKTSPDQTVNMAQAANGVQKVQLTNDATDPVIVKDVTTAPAGN